MREPSRRVEGALVFAGASLLALWWLWPSPAVWSTHSAHFARDYKPAIADFYLIVWALAWDAHAVVTRPPWEWFHANTFFPSTRSLAYSEHFLGYTPLFAPTWWLTGNPILAVNLLVFLTYPLSALAMWALARRWTDAAGAVVAGFFYAFAPWRYLAPPHLHMLGGFWYPLVLLWTDRWLAAGRPRHAVLLAVALTLQATSSVYLGYALFVLYAAALPLLVWHRRDRLDARRLGGLAAAGAAAVAVVGLTLLPYAPLRAVGIIPSYGDERTAIGLVPVIAGNKVREYVVETGIGLVGWLLVVAALAPPWRSARFARALGLVVAVVGLLAAFGPAIHLFGRPWWSPYRLLVDWVPGFASVRLPARFVVIAHVGLALLAGLGFARLAVRAPAALRAGAAAATVVLALVAFGRLPALELHPEATGDRVPAAYRWLAAHADGRALLEKPGGDFEVSARRMYFSTWHWLPIVEGYSGYFPATAGWVHWVSRSLPAESSLQELVDTVDVGWVLVHGDQIRGWQWVWEATLPPGIELAAAFDDDLLFRVTRAPRDPARRDRLLSETETPGGVPLRALGAACPGEIRLHEGPPHPWPALGPATVRVELVNRSGEPWPAFGFLPRHLVRLRQRLLRADGREMAVQTANLVEDLLPGKPVTAAVQWKAPGGPGDYTLELSLVQEGGGPLATCGVAPLVVPVQVLPAAPTAP